MNRVIIWSLAVRVLHLAFAGGLTVALALGFGLDDDHPLFAYHMLAGLFAGGALALRLALGLFGGRHARFADWPLGPSALLRFFRGLATRGSAPEFAGHNPAAAWAMAGMFAVAGGLIWTGLDGGEDIHEGLAVALLALIGAHLAGLAAHSWRHRENIALAMVDGRKRAASGAGLLRHGWVGGLLACSLLAVWAGALWRGYDARGGTLRLPGLRAPLDLGEGAESEGARGEGRSERRHESRED